MTSADIARKFIGPDAQRINKCAQHDYSARFAANLAGRTAWWEARYRGRPGA